MITYGLLDILRQRARQASFHTASGKALRVEFMRFSKGQQLGPLKYEGDILITCLEGGFVVGADRVSASALTQVVLEDGETLDIVCTSDQGAVQIVWAPPFAPAKPE